MAGQFGERAGHWDDHDCSPVRVGVRRGAWALSVDSDDDWNRVGFGVPFRAINGFPTRFRPVWPGQFRPGHHGPIGRPGNHGQHGNHGPIRPGQHGNHGPAGQHGPNRPTGPGQVTPVRPGTPGNGGPSHGAPGTRPGR